MLASILVVVGVLMFYFGLAMGITHYCPPKTDNEHSTNILSYGKEITNEYSLIE